MGANHRPSPPIPSPREPSGRGESTTLSRVRQPQLGLIKWPLHGVSRQFKKSLLIGSHLPQIGVNYRLEVMKGEAYDEFAFDDQEVLGRSHHPVCGLRRYSYIVSFNFWESGLLDLWV